MKKEIIKEANKIYHKEGQSAVFLFANKCQLEDWEYCEPCDITSPQIEHECLVCGSPTGNGEFTITKDVFLIWMFSDIDDINYWGRQFMKEMKEKGKIETTVESVFADRDSLPGWLFKEQMTAAQAHKFLDQEDIELSRIKFINV